MRETARRCLPPGIVESRTGRCLPRPVPDRMPRRRRPAPLWRIHKMTRFRRAAAASAASGRRPAALLIAIAILSSPIFGAVDEKALQRNRKEIDTYVQKAVKDWNVPGLGVGIVIKDKLIFAKGYGYRDYGRKTPFTPTTTVPIASNTKLFTAVATGLLVEEGKLDWDKPVSQFVPSIRFFNDELEATVTVRDMLSHRTGITRHDTIWYKSDFTRKELFERLRFLEPTQPLRHTFLYNNMMYAGTGYI